ncbi:MAG TPA: PmeII family type II restriction endonuclease [Blastocatellia bacterium]|nr:PmeII family type II restriction endonuclease [Blastocatellia bacterium]
MDSNELEELVRKSLDDFYQRRINKLSTLKLKDTLKKKNPYLFRAIGIQKASEIVERLLRDYMSSSDEGIFGDAFFEPIVKIAGGGHVSPSEGVDVAIETDRVYKAIAVKSGPNIFNASQTRRMNDEFTSLRNRLLKLHKQFDALLGHCYGRKSSEPTKKRIYRIRSGEAFWTELTGDPEFYLRLIRLMRDYPVQHRAVFEEEW